VAGLICRMTIRFTFHRLLKKIISSANTIGAVITERNVLTPLRLFVVTMPIQKAVASRKGNRLFTDLLQVQIKNNPRSPQWLQKLNYLLLSDPRHFSLPSTFKCRSAGPPYISTPSQNILKSWICDRHIFGGWEGAQNY
jgi:hypothetical protein